VMALSALVAKQDEKFIGITGGVLKGRQGAGSNRMPNVLFDDLHEAEQITDLCSRLTARPSRKNHDVGHAQFVNLEYHKFSEGGVDVARFAVMGAEGMVEPEQSASKLVASQTNLLTPHKKLSGNDTNNGTAESDKESLLPIHILGWVTGLILVLW
ncbi:MAG: hypothetical protein K8R87_01070, partial [Verrucomicrobia bacterium]|nr:hypothetical protein [Verrucomicrobiota bacterium]